ncbi:MAG: hypothetical protein JO273_22375 [Methylobacteriaceae bacterium]|nr:hypothetical protein [Methylobacteriaceae bacterium]
MPMSKHSNTDNLLDEATSRFVGSNGVVGVARGGDADLTIFVSQADAAQERAVRAWARDRAISVAFVASGGFEAGR